MAIIDVRNLSFNYDTYGEAIFENTSFSIDTDWKLGFIGRNGRGKTTFLNLLRGKYDYQGEIIASVDFEYFPYEIHHKGTTFEVIRNVVAPYAVWEEEMDRCIKKNTDESLERYGALLELYLAHEGYTLEDLLKREMGKLQVKEDVLNRPFETLSPGEQTKLLIAALFLKKNHFLLIDEPTNHLDLEGRQVLANYLKSKKGFILVSHDRAFVDEIVDHILCINRNTIDVQRGNYTTWAENKERQDAFELGENAKLKKEISRLGNAAYQTSNWSDQIEKTKLGTGVIDKGHIGHKSAKMMKRAKNIRMRQEKMIDEKKGLLKNIEKVETLKIHCQPYVKNTLLECINLEPIYNKKKITKPITFSIHQGDRIALVGDNGCGKSSILKGILGILEAYDGKIQKSNQLKISYVSQDTYEVRGTMKAFILEHEVDETLFKTILSKLGFSRDLFTQDLECLSGGQKKKILLAKSLSQAAHLYVWDEPLNFIDVFSRIQIESLFLEYSPTMIFVEHDQRFREKIQTKEVEIKRG